MTLASGSATFDRLTIDGWRQFGSLDLRFDQQLTVLTGANATGKSTILSILGRHFNWGRIYSTAPDAVSKRSNSWSSLARYRASKALERGEGVSSVGALGYSTGTSTPILVPIQSSEERSNYDLLMPGQQPVVGIYMASHRMAAGNYVAVPNIPTSATSAAILDNFTSELRNRWSGQWTQKSPQLALKEGLLVAALMGGGNENVVPNPDLADLWHGYQSILRQVLPKSLGFRRLRVVMPEIVVESKTGNFILDEASGGLSSIIEMSWQIFLRARRQALFVALIDEPENHLHPSLQRELIPNFLKAFPHVQFVIATHSPFVVTASPNATIYALEYSDQRVLARQLDYRNKAASADEVLQRVLGVRSVYPIWAENQFDSIVSSHMRGSMTPEQVANLRSDLEHAGLVSEFPRAVIELTDAELRSRERDGGNEIT